MAVLQSEVLKLGGVRGDFADVGVIEFGHAPADARSVGQGGGAGENVAYDGLGVGG
jgi:hypothetical protein